MSNPFWHWRRGKWTAPERSLVNAEAWAESFFSEYVKCNPLAELMSPAIVTKAEFKRKPWMGAIVTFGKNLASGLHR